MKKHVPLISSILFFFLFIHGSVLAQPGITWTAQTTLAASQTWRSVTYGNGIYAAVAASGTADRVMTSPDGINWTSRTTPADNNWTDITYANGLFVAVAQSGIGDRVMTSPDGINWTLGTTPADNNWSSITYGNGLFVAVAASGTADRVMTSPDGINWTIGTTPADNLWNGVTYANGLFVAVAASGAGNRVMTSPDGITWTIGNSAANVGWSNVTYGNSLFVAVSAGLTGTRVMTSPDGITWTARTGVNNQWMDVIYAGGLFVAVARSGTGNRVMTSPDGITWTARTTPADNDWFGIAYDGSSQLVAIGNTGTGNQVMTSSATPLPLHWLSANAVLNNTNQARIDWQVKEKNIMQYEVQKSTEGTRFITIGIVSGQGDGQHSYTFTESQELQQTTYYRIKQIDLDGSSAYSNILTLRTNRGERQASIYPNPASDFVTLSVSKDLLNKNAIVTDLYGKTLQTIKLTNLSFPISIEQYPAGTYLIKVDQEKAIKIIKE
jgi:hypothetical protein